MNDNKKLSNKDVIRSATEYALKITPSVIALARVAKITPAAFATALSADEENQDYLGGLTAELIKVRRANAKELEEDGNE